MEKADSLLFGILQLDAKPFDIPGGVPGLVACDDTFLFPRVCEVVKGGTVEKMTSGCEELRGPIIDAARTLEDKGVVAIMGTCGFMSLFQDTLQENVKVPVYTSSLLLVPLVYRIIPKGKRIGILTFRSGQLREAHFQAAGWSAKDIPVFLVGVEDQSAWQLIMTPEHPFHGADLERELMDVCRKKVRGQRDLGALVLECAMMPIWAHKIQAEVGVPVFDITNLANLVYESFSRKPFERRRF